MRLVVIYRVRERHKHAGHSRGGEFSHGQGACAADDQVGIGVRASHVVNECKQGRAHACLAIVPPERGNVLLAGLMRDVGPPGLGYKRQSLRYRVIQYLRTQAAAHYQHSEIAAAVAESLLGRR